MTTRMSTSASRTAVQGLLSGALATGPMSLVMLIAGHAGAMGTQPPERLTDTALGAAGVGTASEGERDLAAALAHLGFGAGGGAAFSFLHRRLHLPLPSVAQGVAFGVAVWAVSYQGWIPALGILPPADDDRPGRRRAMIAAHVVYGGVLGAVEARVARDEEPVTS